jgi:orotate phosphoribosyltransferase
MNSTSALSKQVAVDLLTIGAVTLRPKDPFTWTSGIKSPIYCDNRLTMSYPSIRRRIAQGFASIIKEQFPEVEMIAGTATAGIAHAAWVADLMDLPMIYVRDKPKGHGKQNLIEGQLPTAKKVVVIEDLISTGGSSVKAAIAVNDAGGEALAVAAIFTYQLVQAAKNFSEKQIPLHTLSNYEALIDVALGMGKIEQEDVALLKAWREDPNKFAQI